MRGVTAAAPTLQEIRKAHGTEPGRMTYERLLVLNRYVFRPVAFLLTWVAIRIGLTSEAISWLSGVMGLLGCLFLMSASKTALSVGLGMLFLFNLLDCVDGDIARTMHTRNPYGRFLDSVCGGVIDLGFWGVVGIMAFRHPALLHYPDGFGHGPLLWLGLGGTTCFLAITLGYVEQSYDELLHPAWRQLNQPVSPAATEGPLPETGETQAQVPLRVIARNLRVRETYYVLLLITWWIRAVDLLLIMYLAYYGVHVVLALLFYARRGRVVRALWPTGKAQ
jgi:hypothetical protein